MSEKGKVWSEDETNSSYVAAIHTVLSYNVSIHTIQDQNWMKKIISPMVKLLTYVRRANMIYQSDYACVNGALHGDLLWSAFKYG